MVTEAASYAFAANNGVEEVRARSAQARSDLMRPSMFSDLESLRMLMVFSF
jgi:hypothetical protein